MPTANDRFRASFSTSYWLGISGAVLAHFLILVGTPAFAAPRYDTDPTPPLVLRPLEHELPPEPPPIARPATPILGAAEIEGDVTLPTIPFDRYQSAPPPPPRTDAGADAARREFEAFVPSMTRPRVRNAAEVARALERNYPPLLRDAGINGAVDVLLWLDEEGRIVRTSVGRSSGFPAMDAAALAVADVMQLTPAFNRGRAVKVVVSLPIVFRVK